MNKNPMNALSIEEVFEHETFKRIRTLTELSGNGGEPQIWFVARDVCAARVLRTRATQSNAMWRGRIRQNAVSSTPEAAICPPRSSTRVACTR